MVIFIESLRLLLISSILPAGTPPTSTIPTTPSELRISVSSWTRSFFQGAILGVIIQSPLL